MTGMLMLFITVMCTSLGVRVFNTEKQSMIFTKRVLPLKDVKKYNKYCGMLIIGFGIVADGIIVLFSALGEVIASLMPLGLILEAGILLFIYAKMEKSMIQNR